MGVIDDWPTTVSLESIQLKSQLLMKYIGVMRDSQIISPHAAKIYGTQIRTTGVIAEGIVQMQLDADLTNAVLAAISGRLDEMKGE